MPVERLEQRLARDHGGDFLARQDRVGAPLAHPLGDLRGVHLKGSVVRTFSCSFKMPYISISGLGGHPGT